MVNPWRGDRRPRLRPALRLLRPDDRGRGRSRPRPRHRHPVHAGPGPRAARRPAARERPAPRRAQHPRALRPRAGERRLPSLRGLGRGGMCAVHARPRAGPAGRGGRRDARDRRRPARLAGRPTRPDLRRRATLDLGDRRVDLRFLGRGHTDHDVVALVPDASVLFAGDLVEEGAPPSFGDAFPLDWPATLGQLLDLAGEGPVVPGHGEVVDRDFVAGQLGDVAFLAEARAPQLAAAPARRPRPSRAAARGPGGRGGTPPGLAGRSRSRRPCRAGSPRPPVG